MMLTETSRCLLAVSGGGEGEENKMKVKKEKIDNEINRLYVI